MKKIIMWTITIFSLIAAQLCGCVANKEVQPDTLQSITYSEEKAESEYTVMIKENDEYVPYLVLTDNYDRKGRCYYSTFAAHSQRASGVDSTGTQ